MSCDNKESPVMAMGCCSSCEYCTDGY